MTQYEALDGHVGACGAVHAGGDGRTEESLEQES